MEYELILRSREGNPATAHGTPMEREELYGAPAAGWSDGLMPVGKGETSTKDAARKGRKMPENVGARIAGGVVWGLEGGPGVGYGCDYYYSGYYTNVLADGRWSSGSILQGVLRVTAEKKWPS